MKMHKYRKAIWSIVGAVILIAAIVTAVVIRNTAVRKDAEKPAAAVPEEETDYYNGLPINWIEAEYIFEPSDHFYEDLVGFADYVFVGKVLENRGEIYENEQTLIGEGGEEFNYYHTNTEYSVQVEKNIKGNLVENIEIMKDGGLDKSGEFYSIMICDILPELGEKYIIFGKVREDGSLYVGGMKSMIPYTDDMLDTIEAAATNQTVFNRQHHVSIYDVEYDQ